MLFCKIAGAKVVQIEQKTKFLFEFFRDAAYFKGYLALEVQKSE